MLRAVLFDLDGTFLDSTEAIVDSFNHTFGVIGEPMPDRDAVVNSIGYVLEDQFAMLTDHDPADCVRIFRAHYAVVCCDMTHLLPGAIKSCERLREAGCRIGFATSKRRIYAEQVLDHLGALHFFEARIGPDEVTHHKPHPEAVLKACEALAAAPSDAALVGDTHFDVLAAHAAAVRCLCVTTGYATRDDLEALEPEAVYNSLDEVTDHLLKSDR